jgi:hypothetical protein
VVGEMAGGLVHDFGNSRGLEELTNSGAIRVPYVKPG